VLLLFIAWKTTGRKSSVDRTVEIQRPDQDVIVYLKACRFMTAARLPAHLVTPVAYGCLKIQCNSADRDRSDCAPPAAKSMASQARRIGESDGAKAASRISVWVVASAFA
jgi:hypothetical protein